MNRVGTLARKESPLSNNLRVGPPKGQPRMFQIGGPISPGFLYNGKLQEVWDELFAGIQPKVMENLC